MSTATADRKRFVVMVPHLMFLVIPPSTSPDVYPPNKVIIFEFVVQYVMDRKSVTSISLKSVVWRSMCQYLIIHIIIVVFSKRRF